MGQGAIISTLKSFLTRRYASRRTTVTPVLIHQSRATYLASRQPSFSSVSFTMPIGSGMLRRTEMKADDVSLPGRTGRLCGYSTPDRGGEEASRSGCPAPAVGRAFGRRWPRRRHSHLRYRNRASLTPAWEWASSTSSWRGCRARFGHVDRRRPWYWKDHVIVAGLPLLAESGEQVLYVSGEKSPRQIKMRVNGLASAASTSSFSEKRPSSTFSKPFEIKPAAVVVDSIQTVYTEQLTSAPGVSARCRKWPGRLMWLSQAQQRAGVYYRACDEGGGDRGPTLAGTYRRYGAAFRGRQKS